MKTPQELLAPRYKVIADYPDMNQYLEVGKIFNQGFIELQGIAPSKYPHLFKKLEWWEERDTEDMPNYLMAIRDGENKSWYKTNEIKNVIHWFPNRIPRANFINIPNEHTNYHCAYDFLPATEEEYLNYQNSKSK